MCPRSVLWNLSSSSNCPSSRLWLIMRRQVHSNTPLHRLGSIVLVVCCLMAPAAVAEVKETAAQREARLYRWGEARFGRFIHPDLLRRARQECSIELCILPSGRGPADTIAGSDLGRDAGDDSVAGVPPSPRWSQPPGPAADASPTRQTTSATDSAKTALTRVPRTC